MAELLSNLPGKLIENLVLGLLSSLVLGATIALIRNTNTAFQATSQTALGWMERLRLSLNPFQRDNSDGSYNLFVAFFKFAGASFRLAIIYTIPLFLFSIFAVNYVFERLYGIAATDQIADTRMLVGVLLILPLLVIKPIRVMFARIGMFISSLLFLLIVGFLVFSISISLIGFIASEILAGSSVHTADLYFQGVECFLRVPGCNIGAPKDALNIALIGALVTVPICLYFSWKLWRRFIIEYVDKLSYS